uniref:GP-PDE domain-containing protein n=1 Tax=Glossina austeni TaxID=7395 RepID=A0A1A9VG76_GLOAU
MSIGCTMRNRFIFNVFWLTCNLASGGIPWVLVCLLIVCVASKFGKLRSPHDKQFLRLLTIAGLGLYPDLSFWPIAHRGAGYDAPENSKAALRKASKRSDCITRGHRNVLLDAGLTSCGEIVIINRLTLEKASLSGSIALHTLESLNKHFDPEYVYTLKELLDFLEEQRLMVFLLISDNSSLMLQSLKKKSFVYTKHCVDNEISYNYIPAPVIGISVVFVSKEEFNLHIAELWRNVGVRPIVYNVNSPNEKRYFQKTMKTQYLTDSLRSEPHLLMKA